MQGEAPDGVGGIGDGDGWVGCLISSFYIKPQLSQYGAGQDRCCLISSFYIKPQLEMHLCAVLSCDVVKDYKSLYIIVTK